MTDKEKIRAEIERLQDGLMDAQGRFCTNAAESAYHILCHLENFINSMQEESKSKFEQSIQEGDNIVYNEELGCRVNLSQLKRVAKKEEPVSEDLEEASRNYADNEEYGDDVYFAIKAAFKAGAKWQYEQFENNRLAACDRQTKEEADIEINFATSIIEKEHRLPTYDDAIKYGMALKEQQMKNSAIDATIGYWNHSGLSIDVKLPKNLKEGSKCKLIIIKDK